MPHTRFQPDIRMRQPTRADAARLRQNAAAVEAWGPGLAMPGDADAVAAQSVAKQ